MHWAIEKAKELIRNNPGREEFTCASGISPSGSVHIGNFRELITTYFVVRALRKLGKRARFIFSWDDFDRFRKVPKNIDPSYEQYIGMPYSEIPDPYGCCGSYAEHFEKEFEGAISQFGIEVEFIYQSREYKSGRYNDKIIYALENRGKIYDIFMEYKTQQHSEEERRKYYPISLYCHQCGKDNTTILGYCSQSKEIQYCCSCGHTEKMSVATSDNIKLVWKVDWPMRWREEEVIFEPGGTDHSSVGGSFEVSSRIVKELFDYSPPEYIGYEFIGIKGANGKMSSSAGNIITPGELLKVYIPEVVLYIFSKYHPSSGFKFGFDSELTRNYIEFERYRKKYLGGNISEEDTMAVSMEFSHLGREIDEYPSISKIAGLLPILNFDVDALEEVLLRSGESFSKEGLQEISAKVQYWIENWCPEKRIRVRDERDTERIEELLEEELDWVNRLVGVLEENRTCSTDELMTKIYEITRVDDTKETKSNQKRFFKILYNLITGENQGPRLPLLIRAVGEDRVIQLIEN